MTIIMIPIHSWKCTLCCFLIQIQNNGLWPLGISRKERRLVAKHDFMEIFRSMCNVFLQVNVLAEGLFDPFFWSSSLTMVSPSSVPIFVYRLETSSVTKILFSGTNPSIFNLLIKSVVLLVCDSSFSASSLRNVFT